MKMAKDLKNKIVAITGGAEGIGFEIAKQFLKYGAKHVIILDINEDLGKEAVKTLTTEYGNEAADFLQCDVTKDLEKVFKILVDKYQTIDVLVNNAGVYEGSGLKTLVEINVTSVLEWSLKFWEHMSTDKGGKGGTIINMSSVYGFRIDQYVPIYKASKFAILGFSKSLGHECNFKRTGVRVVALCPGFTTTRKVNLEIFRKQQRPDDFMKFMMSPDALWQDVDAVGKAAVEVFQKAASGTAWMAEGDKPIIEV